MPESTPSTWKQRYKAMRAALQLSHADIAQITGNTPGSMKVVATQPDERFPGNLRLAVEIYERLSK